MGLLVFLAFLNVLWAKKLFTPEMNIQMEKISMTASNPGGNVYSFLFPWLHHMTFFFQFHFAFITSQFSLDDNKRTYRLYTGHEDVIDAQQIITYPAVHDLTTTPNHEFVSFISDSDGKSSVILYSPTNGFKSIYTFPVPIDSVRWSSEGNYFVFSCEVYPGKTMQETAEIDKQKAAQKSQYMAFDHDFVYHWDTWETGKFRHVMYMKVGAEDPDWTYQFDGKVVRDIMKSFDGNCPSRPWGLISLSIFWLYSIVSFFFNYFDYLYLYISLFFSLILPNRRYRRVRCGCPRVLHRIHHPGWHQPGVQSAEEHLFG